jgi:hypothetical protein
MAHGSEEKWLLGFASEVLLLNQILICENKFSSTELAKN